MERDRSTKARFFCRFSPWNADCSRGSPFRLHDQNWHPNLRRAFPSELILGTICSVSEPQFRRDFDLLVGFGHVKPVFDGFVAERGLTERVKFLATVLQRDAILRPPMDIASQRLDQMVRRCNRRMAAPERSSALFRSAVLASASWGSGSFRTLCMVEPWTKSTPRTSRTSAGALPAHRSI
jgi:hypothetical protein